jgi:hypothetical protein
MQLYKQAAENGRINTDMVSQESFLTWLSSFRREYILAIHDKSKSSDEIKEGKFESRIAKFSLVQFAKEMHSNNWNFPICCI